MKHRVIGLILLFLSFAGSWCWMDYQSALTKPAVMGKLVSVEIEKGDSLNVICQKLLLQDLSIKPFWFKVIAYFGKTYNKIKTGEYELNPGLTIPDILNLFVSGKTKQYSITFPEGWSLKEILQEVEKNPYLDHQLLKTDFTTLMMQLDIDNKTTTFTGPPCIRAVVGRINFPRHLFF